MKKYRVEVTTPEDDYEKEFSTYQSALNYYTKIRDGNDFWSTIEMYDTETNELLAIEEKSNSEILSYLKEEKNELDEDLDDVDEVDITDDEKNFAKEIYELIDDLIVLDDEDFI